MLAFESQVKLEGRWFWPIPWARRRKVFGSNRATQTYSVSLALASYFLLSVLLKQALLGFSVVFRIDAMGYHRIALQIGGLGTIRHRYMHIADQHVLPVTHTLVC